MNTTNSTSRLNLFIMLPLFVLAIDLFTPYLITNDIIPAEIRWLSHIAIAIMIFLAVLQMFFMNHIPRAVWIMLAVTLVWSYVALGHGQGIPATSGRMAVVTVRAGRSVCLPPT